MTAFDGFRRIVLSSVRSLCVLAIAVSTAASAPAQITQAYIQRIEMLRTQIKTAEQAHAGAAEVGGLWLKLANRYQDLLSLTDAEDAFARSLRLLDTPATQAGYADALDGMGSICLETGRLNDAGEYLQRSLTIYQKLGDRLHAAALHNSIALMQLNGRHYREAEAESAEALTQMQALAKPDPGELVAAYLAHSYALCGKGRYSEALSDVDRAMFVAEASLQPDSIEMAAVWLARGFDQWKAGAPDDAERAMGASLHLLRGRTDLPQPTLANLQLGVMRQYDTFLKGTHRKPEQKQMEAEMARLQAQQPSACNGCTVSVAALAPGLLLP
jgi:tetratricopeptide (TPR) repeat protein